MKDVGREDTFEFEALDVARNYRCAILKAFRPYLGSHTVEIGAGIGQFSSMLSEESAIKQLYCVEPDPDFIQQLGNTHEDIRIHHGTVHDLDSSIQPDCIVSINVLEHIEDDRLELKTYAEKLRKKNGYFCLFTPAGPGIYAPLDEKFGHYRRYSKGQIQQKFIEAGFKIEQCRYFNFPGFFLWALEYKFLKREAFNIKKVSFFDRFLFPLIHQAECLIPPPIGQSLFVVGSIR